MVTACIRLTIQNLFELLYDTIHKEVPNPDYKDSYPSCEHYKSLDEMKDHIFCPKCGNKNHIVSYPKTISVISYAVNDICKKYFALNAFENGSSKNELIVSMLNKLIGSKGVWTADDPCIYIKDEDECCDDEAHGKYKKEYEFKLDADNHNNSFCLLSHTYEYCPKWRETHDKIMADIEKYLNNYFYIICYEHDGRIDVKYLKDCIKKVKLFNEIGFDNIMYTKIKEYDDYYHSDF
jgi:hypothetical protein